MRKKFAFVLAALIVVALSTGCAKPPQQEIDGAKAALAAAEGVAASKWAPEAWDKAQQAMNAVNAELQVQEQKFALFRSYTKAKELAAAATQAANEAKDAAVAGKEKAKNDAKAAIDGAKAAVADAQAVLKSLDACKRKPKDFKKDAEALKASIDGLAGQVTAIDSQFASEDYLGAKSAADSLKGQVDKVKADMAAAKEKIKCK